MVRFIFCTSFLCEEAATDRVLPKKGYPVRNIWVARHSPPMIFRIAIL